MKPKNKSPRDIGFYVLVFIILISAVYLLTMNQAEPDNSLIYSEVERLFMDEEVESFSIKDNTLTMQLKTEYNDSGSTIVTHDLFDVGIFHVDMDPYIDEQMEKNPDFEYNYDPAWQSPWWVQMIPYAIIIVVFIFLWNAMMNRSGVGGDKSVMKFGKAKTRLASDDKKKVTFADVAGADEEKEELREIVDFLKGPQKYITLGARIPKGVLLIGPPGTG